MNSPLSETKSNLLKVLHSIEEEFASSQYHLIEKLTLFIVEVRGSLGALCLVRIVTGVDWIRLSTNDDYVLEYVINVDGNGCRFVDRVLLSCLISSVYYRKREYFVNEWRCWRYDE